MADDIARVEGEDRAPEVTYYDADMKPCAPEDAVRAHVVDHDGTDDPPRYFVDIPGDKGGKA
jgi:hypothetical protein